ncbi:MAG TPA: hypothetical protein VHO50_01340 [Bacteroidales bacterium]|nr:hypothetical protein [Bacteroidales bacterium]
MEDLKTIVKGTKATMSHVCHGIVYYNIETEKHKYQLAINSMDDEFTTTYLEPEFKAITLMRWIRKGINDGTLVLLK